MKENYLAETGGGKDVRRTTPWEMSYGELPEYFYPFGNLKDFVFALFIKQISSNPLFSPCMKVKKVL